MSKKVKLLGTCAALCLSLALMVFGVYAAGLSAFEISSNVTFTASDDVYGKFEASVKLNDGTPTSVTPYEVFADGSATTGAATGNTLADQTLTAVDDTVVYEFKFTNNSRFDVTVTVTGTQPTSQTINGVETITVTQAQTFTVKSGEANSTTLTVKLNSLAADTFAGDIDLTLTAAKTSV